MDMDRRRIIRRPDVPSAMITQAGVMTAITTSRPMIRELAPAGEPLGRRWLKNILTAALAGIARPERFFQSLRDAGIRPGQTVALPDHARLTAADLPEAEAVFITEKDAVKLAAAPVPENVWVLPVRAIIRPDLAAELAGRLKTLSAQKKDET